MPEWLTYGGLGVLAVIVIELVALAIATWHWDREGEEERKERKRFPVPPSFHRQVWYRDGQEIGWGHLFEASSGEGKRCRVIDGSGCSRREWWGKAEQHPAGVYLTHVEAMRGILPELRRELAAKQGDTEGLRVAIAILESDVRDADSPSQPV